MRCWPGAAVAALLAVCCSGLHTRAPCMEEGYGIIEVWNFTDADKTVFVQRVVQDSLGEGLLEERVVPVDTALLRAHTARFYRLYPGLYVFGLKHADGQIDAFRGLVTICGFITVKAAPKRPGDKERVIIKPRRDPGPRPDYFLLEYLRQRKLLW